jgi:acetyl esterase/lipase
VYYPPFKPQADAVPVLFFVYGGGLSSGERNFPPPVDLAYRNVGAYFAKQGFIVVIPDYQLVPKVSFPEPARDLRSAMEWVVDHPTDLTIDGLAPDRSSLCIFAHSAGATHVFTMLALPELFSSSLSSRIKGVALFSGAYALGQPTGWDVFDKIVIQYYGSNSTALQRNPFSLLKESTPEQLKALPPILILDAEKDPIILKTNSDAFHDALASHPELDVTKKMATGHNHISITWVLCTGEGEEWAEDMVAWMKDKGITS